MKKLWLRLQIFLGLRSECCHAAIRFDEQRSRAGYGERWYCTKCYQRV